MTSCCCAGNDNVAGLSANAPAPYDKSKQGAEMTLATTKADAVFLQMEDTPGQMAGPNGLSLSDHKFMKSTNNAIIDLDEDDADDMPEWSEPPPPANKQEDETLLVVEDPPEAPAIPEPRESKEEGKSLRDDQSGSRSQVAIANPSVIPAEGGCKLNKTKNTLAVRFMRAAGENIGYHPCKVCCFSFVVMLILLPLGFRHAEFVGGKGLSPDVEFSELWTEKGGELEEELDIVKKYRKKEWDIDNQHIMMAYGRDGNAGKNAITPQALKELLPVMELWHNIQVTTKKGNTYSTYDICRRSIVPDVPQAWSLSLPPMLLPCIIVTPLLCFKEYADVGLHPLYAFIDKLIGTPMAPQAVRESGWVSFFRRPSLDDMDTPKMLEEISKLREDGLRGCQLFSGGTVTPTAFLGEIQPKWSVKSTSFESAAGIRNLFYYDPPGTISFRLNFSKPQLTNKDDIQEAIDLHSEKFSEEVFKMSDNNPNQFFEFTNLRPGGLEAAAEEGRKLPAHLLILGVVLLYSYFFCVTVDFRRPAASRTIMATNGLLLILMALLTSMSLYFAFGGTLNVAVIIGVPLLQLGLAADDMFVILHYFNDLGEDYIRSTEKHVVLGELCCRCSMGVIVTSVCNFIAFLCGTFLPLRGLADFCMGVAICALVNLFFVMTEFLPCMCLEIQRIKDNRPEKHPFVYFCHKRALQNPTSASSERQACKARINNFLMNSYSPFLLRLPVRIIVSIVSVTFFVLMVIKTTNKDIGWNPGAVAAKGTEANLALPMLFDHFQMFPISLIFRPGLDVVANQKEMLELHRKLSSTKLTTWGTSQPYLTLYYSVLAQMSQTKMPGSNATYSKIGFKTDPTGWTDEVLAPYGLGPTDPQIFYSAWHSFAKPPFVAEDWVGSKEQVQAKSTGTYVWFDLADNQKFTFGPPPLEQFEFSWFGFSGIDLDTDEAIVECIEETIKIVKDSPLKDHAFINSLTFSYWRAFMDLESKMWILLLVCLIAIAFVTMLILRSIRAAVVGVFCSAMIVFELYGMCMFWLKFNPFIVATLLSGAGLSVEFISHTVAAFFIEGSGSLKSRLGQAMKQTFLPVVHGSLSTGLTVFPLLFAPVEFITMYQCLPVYLLIAIGFINSFVFLPAMLGLAHCGCETKRAQDDSDA